MMRWLSKLSLYYRMNGIIIGFLLLLSSIIGVVVTTTTSSLLERQIDRRGAEIGTSLAVLSSNDILLDDRYALFERINTSKDNSEDVRYILVVDYAGRLLAHTFGSQLPQGLPMETGLTIAPGGGAGYRVTKYDSSEGLIHEIMVPIENGAVGFVRVGMSEQSSQELLRLTMKEFFLTTLFVCVLASLGVTHLAYFIIMPIRDLARAADQIRHGNYAVQAAIQDEGEVGQLALAFNGMARTLQEKEAENDRLMEELRAKEALRATLLQKLFTVQEDERKRISRELHDETGQSLASILAYMKLLQSKLADPQQEALVLQTKEVVTEVLGGLRKMAVELRPPVLDDLGIVAAMERYIVAYREQQRCRVEFQIPDEVPVMDSTISLALYRILQESLTNIAKHARASRVTVRLAIEGRQVRLTISDDGRGLGPNDLLQAQQKNRLGIYGMQERAELLGGRFEVLSETGEGATIQVTLPMRMEGIHD